MADFGLAGLESASQQEVGATCQFEEPGWDNRFEAIRCKALRLLEPSLQRWRERPQLATAPRHLPRLPRLPRVAAASVFGEAAIRSAGYAAMPQARAARGAGRGARGACDVSFAPVLQAAFKILRCMSSRALEVNHFHLGAAVMACEKATRCACGMRGVARVAGFGVANGAQPEPRGAWNASCRVLVCSDLPP